MSGTVAERNLVFSHLHNLIFAWNRDGGADITAAVAAAADTADNTTAYLNTANVYESQMMMMLVQRQITRRIVMYRILD